MVIRTSEEKHIDPTNPPVDEGVSNSPFKGLSELECYHKLHQIYEDTGSELYHYFFIIMDERSIKDDTVLLCGYFDDEDKVETMRVKFDRAQVKISVLSIGHQGFEDDI